jgi:cell division transport system permease protein
MALLWHRLRFFVTDAWDELRHSPGVNLLAITTLASALFLAGLVVLVLVNVESRVERLREDVRVEVYLEDASTEEQARELQAALEALPGVARVDYVDRAEALARYRTWASDMVELIEELETNPLPASLEIFLEPGPGAETLGSGIALDFHERPEIEEIRFDRDWLMRLEALLNLARLGGSGLALVVFAAVVFVMASVLRLAVYARRDEIEIMQLVGATPSFVRGPFLVAGVAQGLISSALALLLVEAARRAALSYAEEGSLALLDLVASQPLPAALTALTFGAGLAVSCTGAWFAVRRSF